MRRTSSDTSFKCENRECRFQHGHICNAAVSRLTPTPPSTRFSSSSTFTSWPSNTKYSPSCSSLPKRLHFPASAGRGSEEYYLNYEYRILRSSLSRPTSVALMLVTVIISLRPSRKLLPEMLLSAWRVILGSITSRQPISFPSDALHTKYHPPPHPSHYCFPVLSPPPLPPKHLSS